MSPPTPSTLQLAQSAALLVAFQSTLEEAAFLFSEPTDTALATDEPIAATLALSCPGHHELLLVVGPDLATLLAANLLGVEPDSPTAADASIDAVGELLNVASGVFVEAWLGPGTHYELGTPMAATPAAGAAAVATARLVVEDEHVLEVFLTPRGDA